jgi:flagellar motor switch protein FliG
MNKKLANWIRRRIFRTDIVNHRRGPAVLVAGGIAAIGLTGIVLWLCFSGGASSSQKQHPSAAAPRPENPLAELAVAAGSTDIWQTQAQRQRRWQVAKMAALGGRIEKFPAVCEAVVLLETGSRPRPGKRAVGPTAAAHVTLQPGEKMTAHLLGAIAELVAGSVAGLKAADVCVIDNAGRSYRIGDEFPPDPAEQLCRQIEAEKYYNRRVGEALGYVRNLSITIRAGFNGNEPHCRAVTVSIPRSYFVDVYNLSTAAQAGPSGAVPNALIENESERLRQAVCCATGAAADAVDIRWHYDVPAGQRECEKTPVIKPSTRHAWAILLLVVLGAMEIAAVSLIVVRRLARRRRRLARARVRAAARRRKERAAADSQIAVHPFEALKQASEEDLITLLSPESPELIALALSHLSPARAARVLAGLGGGRQIEVTREIAALEELTPADLRRAERALAARLGSMTAQRRGRPGGVSAVARILTHAGQAGRKKVLEALHEQAPQLAETISRRLLGFEDIAELPADRLSRALGKLRSDELALALWTVNERLQRKVLSALSKSQRRQVQRQMGMIGPVRLGEVESAQQQVVELVREYEAGQLAHVATGDGELLA